MLSSFAELAATLYPLRSGTFVELPYADRIGGTLSLYRPLGAARPPLAVLFHGGGWTKGSPAKNIVLAAPLMLAGWAVANVQYRLAHEAPAPGAVEDAIAAVDACFTAAGAHEIDEQRMVLFGISAGGHLALNAGLDPARPQGKRPAAIVDLYGVADPAALLDGPAAQPFARAWFGGGPEATALANRLSPLRLARNHPALPPVFIVHGTEDELVPFAHSQALHDALAAAGGDVELLAIPGRHGDFTLDARREIFAGVEGFLAARGLWTQG